LTSIHHSLDLNAWKGSASADKVSSLWTASDLSNICWQYAKLLANCSPKGAGFHYTIFWHSTCLILSFGSNYQGEIWSMTRSVICIPEYPNNPSTHLVWRFKVWLKNIRKIIKTVKCRPSSTLLFCLFRV
jgi:hypothetical protein